MLYLLCLSCTGHPCSLTQPLLLLCSCPAVQWGSRDAYYEGALELLREHAASQTTATCEYFHALDEPGWEAWRMRMDVPDSGSGSDRSDGRQNKAVHRSAKQLQQQLEAPLKPDELSLAYFFVYNRPSFLSATLEGIAWAFGLPPPAAINRTSLPGWAQHQPAPRLKPDVLILNAGIWWVLHQAGFMAHHAQWTHHALICSR